MIGLLLICHGGLAQAFLEAATRIVGDVECAYVVTNDGKTPAGVEDEVRAALASMSETEGIVIMTDLVGSSCWRAGMARLRDPGLQASVFSGVNLGMVLSFCQKRKTMDFRQLSEAMAEDGRRGITGPTFSVEAS